MSSVPAFVKRVAGAVKRRFERPLRRRRAHRVATYSARPFRPPARLFAEAPEWQACISREVLDRYLDHEFDLLGSGWTRVTHGMSCRGLEGHRFDPVPPEPLERRINPANRAASLRIARLIDESYTPIDWQLDFKSGYRWSEATWHGDVEYGNVRGADVKVPWELARVQHLPEMAVAYAVRGDAAVLRELRNQVLDFVSANPPGFGVNWACTMDVAIRAANLVLAWDILASAGVEFDPEFAAVFRGSIWDHAWHIIRNPERYGDIRANHYLAAMAGFAFVAAWLPIPRFLDATAKRLIEEMEHQFNPDGSNFEGSTAYHRLSGEMIACATALLAGRGYEFPDWYLERLGRIAQFTRDTTKPDGSMHQVGDNDSGRFFRVLEYGDGVPVIPSVVEGSGRSGCAARRHPPRSLDHARDDRDGVAALQNARTLVFASEEKLENIRAIAYPDFGLYILRNDRFYAAVVCRGADWRGMTGHLHNDALALELSIGGRNLIRDPGSYVYTPLPEVRNRYRSVHAHFTPWCRDEEPASLEEGLFRLSGNARGVVHHFAEDGFAGEIVVNGIRMTREIRIGEFEVTVIDTCDGGVPRERERVPFSPGYGVIEP